MHVSICVNESLNFGAQPLLGLYSHLNVIVDTINASNEPVSFCRVGGRGWGWGWGCGGGRGLFADGR